MLCRTVRMCEGLKGRRWRSASLGNRHRPVLISSIVYLRVGEDQGFYLLRQKLNGSAQFLTVGGM